MIRILRRLMVIINGKALIITLMAVLSTALCQHFGLTISLPLTLVATAVVFPIVFSISGAYKRRETALSYYGSMKTHGRAIFYAARDWPETPNEEVVERAKRLLGDVFRAARSLFHGPVSAMVANEEKVYAEFSNVSKFVKSDLRDRGMAAGEASRVNQFLSKMMLAFESTKHVYQYRTPKTLRAFSDFFIVVLPLAYGPHFAHMASETAPGLHFIMPVLLSVILVSLDNIQDHLENPFDQIGEDDVTINAEKFVKRLDL
ncbi:MAG: hypothetical protein ACYS47_10615 [Planctomycetota bacterium]|jgi:hypothetical protein